MDKGLNPGFATTWTEGPAYHLLEGSCQSQGCPNSPACDCHQAGPDRSCSPFPAQGYSDPTPLPFQGLRMEAGARDADAGTHRSARTGRSRPGAAERTTGRGREFGQHQRPHAQGLGQPGLCPSGLLPGHLPSTLGLSKFYFNQRLVKRALSENEPGSANPLLKPTAPGSQARLLTRATFPASVRPRGAPCAPHVYRPAPQGPVSQQHPPPRGPLDPGTGYDHHLCLLAWCLPPGTASASRFPTASALGAVC